MQLKYYTYFLLNQQHSQVRSNPVVARTISQSSVSTPVKATPTGTPTTIITVKMPVTAPVTASAGASVNAAAVPASKVVGTSVTVKQEPIGLAATHTVQKPGVATATAKTIQVGSLFLHFDHSLFGGVKLETHLCSQANFSSGISW